APSLVTPSRFKYARCVFRGAVLGPWRMTRAFTTTRRARFNSRCSADKLANRPRPKVDKLVVDCFGDPNPTPFFSAALRTRATKPFARLVPRLRVRIRRSLGRNSWSKVTRQTFPHGSASQNKANCGGTNLHR